MEKRPPILLFDGECSFCNRNVQWILRNDRRGKLHFASLQSEVARSLVGGERSHESGSVLLVYPDGRVLDMSDAAISTLELMGRGGAARGLRIIPRPLRDWGYRLVAQNRHRIAGSKACGIPPAEHRRRIIESLDELPQD